jgi:penicillin-binding protein 1A
LAANARAGSASSGTSDGGPPPVLTRRGADILVRMEKAMEDAAKLPDISPPPPPATAPKTTSSAVQPAFPDSFASTNPRDGKANARN